MMNNNKIFGFWIYLMSDFILFSTLFATYLVLHKNIANGPSGKEIFNLFNIMIESLILLVSGITLNKIKLYIKNNNINYINILLIVTFILGLIFVVMEGYEFLNLIKNNFGPNHSAFLSAFFILVGMHGLHVIIGLIWLIVMIIKIYKYKINLINKISLHCLSLFWHFIDIIWIFVYTIVYLMESL